MPQHDDTHGNPHNLNYPEIVTETEAEENTESTEEQKLLYESGTPKGTSLIKKVTVTKTKIRTTTPYTGTI
ncbi:hypothetical protein [Rhizobium leguminosarum]|uniref:hypothetical protein n=1 Tax=Rhizobium leguminosarum TaxID=384 RepID=UPI001C929214|nr:hypothetical protein [Rhizobium leguminosarum]MBY2927013.1 hypothetical protein [Rhizobium leguminosarum]MBY2937519.1 hypothetical protein [Rhizobium leguminosarum]MBY3003334.1 hypothetical protein [Rhizobium leguminosarum]MBY3026155.1 hypothetical protein [Rhizobium leguminosarum]